MTAPIPFAILAGALRIARDQEEAGIEASARYGLAPSAKEHPQIAALLVACLEQQTQQARLLNLAHAWLVALAPHEPLVRALIDRPDIQKLVADAIAAPASIAAE